MNKTDIYIHPYALNITLQGAHAKLKFCTPLTDPHYTLLTKPRSIGLLQEVKTFQLFPIVTTAREKMKNKKH